MPFRTIIEPIRHTPRAEREVVMTIGCNFFPLRCV